MEMSSPNSLTSCRNFTLSQICDQAPLLCLRPLSTPCLPCPCPSYPSTRWHLPPEFYFKWDGVSKAHTSDTPVAWTCADSLGEGLAEQWPGAGLPQKTVIMQWQTFRDYGKSQHTASSSFHHTLVYLSQYQQTWLLSGVHWDFCPWGGCMASVKCTQAGEWLLLMWHRDPSNCAACSWGFTLLPH